MSRELRWRDQTERERELLEAILLADIPEPAAVAAQARNAEVATNCGCGCGSFQLRPRPSKPAGALKNAVLEGHGLDDAGNEVGLALFARDGVLDFVECYALAVDPMSLPRPETLRQFRVVRESDSWERLAPLGENDDFWERAAKLRAALGPQTTSSAELTREDRDSTMAESGSHPGRCPRRTEAAGSVHQAVQRVLSFCYHRPLTRPLCPTYSSGT